MGATDHKLEDIIESGTVKRELGSNFLERFVSSIYDDASTAILEFVANSYDADAERVDINIDFDKDILEIIDSGKMAGMTRNQINGFYRIGDSDKEREPISPRGRRRIGKFGIGTLLLARLCNEYELVSVKDEKLHKGSETIERPLSIEAEIPMKTFSSKGSKPGTKIRMKDLMIEEGESFSVYDLKKRLSREMPLLPDFKVYVNDEKIQQWSIKNAREFKVDMEGENIGKVEGSLYLPSRATNLAGMHVYVNKRRVGNPKKIIDVGKKKQGLANKVIGIIHANGLEPDITFDRTRFSENSKLLKEFKGLLDEKLNEVARYAKTKRMNTRISNINDKKDKILKKVKKRLMKKGLEGIDKSTELLFSTEFENGTPGKYENNKIFLNENYSQLNVTRTTRKTRFEESVLSTIVDVIAKDTSDGSLESFLKNREKMWGVVKKGNTKPIRETFPSAMYEPSELASLKDWSYGSINYIIKSGALSEDAKIQGKEFMELDNKIKGLIPLFEFVKKDYDGANLTNKVEQLTGKLKEIEEGAFPFIRRIGRWGDAYLVERLVANEVHSILVSDYFDGRKKDLDPVKPFNLLRDNHFSSKDLRKRFSISIDQYKKVISHTNREDLRIRRHSEDKSKLHFGDFIFAIQDMRGNNTDQDRALYNSFK